MNYEVLVVERTCCHMQKHICFAIQSNYIEIKFAYMTRLPRLIATATPEGFMLPENDDEIMLIYTLSYSNN